SELSADAEEKGDVLSDVVASVRRWKSEEGLALNAELDSVEIYTEYEIEVGDAANALNAEVVVESGSPELEEIPVEVDPDMSIIGPEYRDRAGDIVGALKAEDAGDVLEQKESGTVTVEVDGDTVE
ncbi:MAG: valine--tRNA ligase, partial [Halobacteria archaeon]|nr:valine--tRNA ligase [Halobacteria archaeon]